VPERNILDQEVVLKGWTEEIVWTRTDDAIIHDGVVMRPTGSSTGTTVVWMHGYTGNFSEQHQTRIGRYLAERGHTFVSGNNRGHDFGVRLVGEPGGEFRVGGGWWELASESWLDIKAWLDFASTTLSPRRLILAGHSYGAVKVTRFQGERQDARVHGLISASGPVRPPSQRPEFGEALATARRMVAEGEGLNLLPFGTAGRLETFSAQTLVDRAEWMVDTYGMQGGDSPLSNIRCPLLAILGTKEPQIGSPDDLELLKLNARASARADTALIEGANHWYTGCEERVAEAIYNWLAPLA
jgi:pimeloyl-ACP methyl ester carboxylesterase